MSDEARRSAARRGVARHGKVTWVGAGQHNHRERMTGENAVLREQLRKAEAADAQHIGEKVRACQVDPGAGADRSRTDRALGAG
jgi:hypothetical protein